MVHRVDVLYKLKSIPSRKDLCTVQNIVNDIKINRMDLLNNWMDDDSGRNFKYYPEFPLIITSIKFNKETGLLEKLEFSEGYVNE